MNPTLRERLEAELNERRKAQLYRQRQELALPQTTPTSVASHAQQQGRMLLNFSSNDYLGLAQHPRIINAACEAARRFGAGASASPLVTGHTSLHAEAERSIASWKSCEASLLLPSGYQAAMALIQTLAVTGARFLIDKLVHASLIDAVMAASVTKASYRVFPHNDLSKLQRLLSQSSEQQPQVVVTESIFSMDGDAADLPGLASLKEQHGFMLVLDEAHGTGVYGEAGAGYAQECGLDSIVDATIVTLSKAMGVAGGAICASSLVCDAVVNLGRAYIYSTAVAPFVAGGAIAAIDVMRTEPWRQQRVRLLARQTRARLKDWGMTIVPGDSPIIPLILGTEDAALRASATLREAGFIVAAIRPPTVARGTSRLRISLSCEHTDAHIDALLGELANLLPPSAKA